MSKYSETIGSFSRTGNYPLEADYIFSTEKALREFYSDEINATTLHKGLFKIVEDDGSGNQVLYWVINSNNELTFTKLISGNSLEDILGQLSALELDLKQLSERDYVVLDETGKIPSTYLPSYIDSIIDVYASYTVSDTGILQDIILYSDPEKTTKVIGEPGKIYQNVTPGEPAYQFRWTGSIFAQTGASSLIIGEVTGTAYDGQKGKDLSDKVSILISELEWYEG